MTDKGTLNSALFNDLLVSAGLAPAIDFPESQIIIYAQNFDSQLRPRIRFILGKQVRFQRVESDQLQRATRHWRAELSPELEDSDGLFSSDFDDSEDLKDLASEAPVIKLVNHLFALAMDLNASDIHFEPEENRLVVRCRVDGVMTIIETLPANAHPAISSRLKLMAKLDIGEKRLPQDGRINMNLAGKPVDMRVSTLPGVHGESIVLRLLDRSDVFVELEALGMPENVLNVYQTLIRQPHGMILITGPTGSGKTTTLYATLEKIKSEKFKIITVEDPVEYQLGGITQIQANAKIGLNFATGLRSIVRQDPDIIMIGEIRDHETAEMAIESALTGHLVFSTLHTNDAAGAITRLQDMGVESYLISSSLLGVQAQRLVRRICEYCAEEQPLSEDEALALEIAQHECPTITRGVGCERCGGSGYRGRVGLYELLESNKEVRHLIATESDANQIREAAKQTGMRTLREDALAKLRQGMTTPEEVIRVTRAV